MVVAGPLITALSDAYHVGAPVGSEFLRRVKNDEAGIKGEGIPINIVP
jgi:hypothetical protein